MSKRFGTERGATFWQLLVIAVVVGFFVLVGLKVVPLYLNELKVATAVKQVAQEPGLSASASLPAIRRALSRHWDIDDIDHVTPNDIVVARDGTGGTTLSWNYDARAHLFYNVFVVINFTGLRVMGTGGAG